MSAGRLAPARRAGALSLAGALAGCSVTETFHDLTRVDDNTAHKREPLDIPPDLVTPRGDDRFAVPDRVGQGTTYSQFARGVEQRPASATGPVVMPARPGVRIERQGSQRWLVVDSPPDKVWPVVRDFWTDAGFALRLESPETGIMETDWAEKRVRVPDTWVRSALSKALNSLYSTAERDKFRTRLETDGKVTEVFVSHRGMVEELTGPQKDTSVWVPRSSDPELEAEFLRRMMLKLSPPQVASAAPSTAGSGGAGAPATTPAAAPPPARARVVQADGRPYVALQEGFDRSWRQVGLALDRSGFTVEDRDRSKGTFFVRYVDPEQEAKATGVLDRVFGSGGSRKDLTGRRYRIVLEPSEPGTRVGVLGEDGAPPSSDTDRRIATQIVGLLRDQLR
ncbi:MAG: outer membrane protein assembly factor BamC [Burkholderiales bacterium]